MSTFIEADHPRLSNGTFTDKPQSAPEVSLGGQYAIPGVGERATISSEGWPTPPGMEWGANPAVEGVKSISGEEGVVVTAQLRFKAPKGFAENSRRMLSRIFLATDTEGGVRDGVVYIDIEQFFHRDEFTPHNTGTEFARIANLAGEVMTESGYRGFAASSSKS